MQTKKFEWTDLVKLESKDEATGRMMMVPVEGEFALEAELVLIAAGPRLPELCIRCIWDRADTKNKCKDWHQIAGENFRARRHTAGDRKPWTIACCMAIHRGREAARAVDESLMIYQS